MITIGVDNGDDTLAFVIPNTFAKDWGKPYFAFTVKDTTHYLSVYSPEEAKKIINDSVRRVKQMGTTPTREDWLLYRLSVYITEVGRSNFWEAIHD